MARPIANVSHDGKKFRVSYRYTDPVTGKVKNSCKRGFKLKREAEDWIVDELPALIARLEQKRKTIDTMTMDELIEEYRQYIAITARKTTMGTKDNIIQSKILPHFKGKLVVDIEPIDIINWQVEMSKPIKKVVKTVDKNGKKEKKITYERYSRTYLHTINNQIVAIFNYAKTIRKLKVSPCQGVVKMGSKDAPEREIWEPEDFEKFIKTQEHNPLLYYAYLTLFWTGVREAELLGIRKRDLDLKNGIVYVKEAYHKVEDEVDTRLKNKKSYRTVKIPSFLIEELKDFTESLGPLEPNSHIFETSKSTLLKHLHEGAAKAGVEDICVHCLRHSYISMCVYNGIPYTTISTQVGHSKFLQTLHYSHSYKNSGDFLVNALEQVKGGVANV
ncbi:MAG: site-specific integrase [Ruminococcaceae bacterium]|nr:site-specific integrase [Oscillospiraceae bacterium]